jgi:hypothetical protein
LRPNTPAKEPPQTELATGPAGGEAEEVAQESFRADVNQSLKSDPTEPEPISDDDFDQSGGA